LTVDQTSPYGNITLLKKEDWDNFADVIGMHQGAMSS